MNKRLYLLLGLLLVLAMPTASADVWQGSTAAAGLTDVTAGADGILSIFDLQAGAQAAAGDVVGEIRTSACFSPIDGEIAAMHAEAGDQVSGTVLEIDPVSRYSIVCTVTGARQVPENTLVHIGETLYVKCTADGSHRAVGRIVAIDGSQYTVEVTGGELYIGETVWLYRDAGFASGSRVGSGTVLSSDPVACTADGELMTLLVAEGDSVSRGQLLYTTATDRETAITVPVSGLVTEISVSRGDQVRKDETVAVIAQRIVLRVPVDEDSAGNFHVGDELIYTRADDPHETAYTARVSRILSSVADGGVTVELIPEEADLPAGLSIELTDERDAE